MGRVRAVPFPQFLEADVIACSTALSVPVRTVTINKNGPLLPPARSTVYTGSVDFRTDKVTDYLLLVQ